MRSATAGACGSNRRTPRPRLPPACSFFLSDYQTGIIEHAVSNRRGQRLKPPHPPAKIASRMQFFLVGRRREVPSAPWTWCFKTRKSLFFRREAPRRPVRPALRRRGRGASRPANPYSFVERHHVPEPIRPFGAVDVVLQSPQILILSSGGTTSLSPSVPAVPWTWCFKARKTLFLRRGAPRP